MITKFGPCLSLICVMVLIQKCSAFLEYPEIERLKMTLNEDFVTPTRPTWDMVSKALIEFQSLSEGFQADLLEDRGTRLLYHSVLLPFDTCSHQVEDEDLRENFLDSLFWAYKWFWPYYHFQIFVQGAAYETRKCNFLYEVAANLRTDVESLSVDDFDQGVIELRELVRAVRHFVYAGQMPRMKNTIAEMLNALVMHKNLLETAEEVRFIGARSGAEILQSFKRRISEESRRISSSGAGPSDISSLINMMRLRIIPEIDI